MRPKNADLVAPLLVNQRCHGCHFEPHSLGLSSCQPPSMMLFGTRGT